MDPNETLRRIRALLPTLRDFPDLPRQFSYAEEGTPDARIADAAGAAEELAELATALDEWLSRGGFYPDAWQANR